MSGRVLTTDTNGKWSRREVLLTMAGTAAVGGCMRPKAPAPLAALPEEPKNAWPDVRVVYVRPKGKYWLGWPGTAWDVEGFTAKTRGQVEQFAKELRLSATFEPEPLYDEPAVDAFIAKVKQEQPKGIVLFPLHMNQWGMVDKIAQSGIPTVIFAPLGVCFTGHIATVSKRPGVYLASCADFELKPVRFGLKMIRTAHDVGRMKIAVVANRPLLKAAGRDPKETRLDPLGLTLRSVARERFPEVVKTIEETPEVLALAEQARRAARKVVEPTREDFINAAKNYFAALKLMKEEGCSGITMDCLGLIHDRELLCPPCLAWSRLLDVGIPGVCEADINAVMSHTLCCRLLDKPGFQQDPVPNTVRNTLIGAHCTCATRLNGYDQPREPFIFRSHS